jgi:hypothetical protein
MVRTALVALVALGWCGCDGELVNLGSSAPLISAGDSSAGSGAAGSSALGGAAAGMPAGEWLEPQLLFPQTEARRAMNPSFTETEDTVVYTEQEQGDDTVARAYRRMLVGGIWSEPELLSVAGDVASPVVSADGKQLWFGQNVAEGLGATDIWLGALEGGLPAEHFSAPLNSSSDDAPRPLAVTGTLMPLSSKRHGGVLYQIYLARRAAADQPWQDVSRDLLASVNSDQSESVDGFLTPDGLTLYFSSTRNLGQRGDLFVAQRSSLNDAFSEPRLLNGVNTVADERDPWLSRDGQTLYFASDRPNLDFEQYAIYRSQRAR